MKLDLCIPGLLAAPARLVPQLRLPDAPALQRWMTRARTHGASSGRFGYVRDRLAVQHTPLAALAWLGACETPPQNPVMLATPVHFKAGMHDLVLFAGPALDVTPDECAQLARDANAFFGGEPALEFAAGQLFMKLPPGFDVETAPLNDVLGRPVRERLPTGSDARRLHAWMNELQMFLHGHALNRERATRGLPSLNGLWLWGEGALPERANAEDIAVFAQSLPMRGLGRLCGDVHEPRALHDMLPASGRHVIEVTACVDALDADDIAGWQSAVKRISRELLQPVLDWLAMSASAEATLYAGDATARAVRGGNGLMQRMRQAFRRRAELTVNEEG